MTKVYIFLENCYGIPKFDKTFIFDNDTNKGHLIYAPNGVMKTSLANTISDICNGKESRDCFFPERNTMRIVRYEDENGDDLKPEDILVIEPYSEKYKSENMSTLLADEKLKSEFDKIHLDIDEKMNKMFSNLKNLSGKRDVDKILAEDFGYSPNEVYECLDKIYDDYSSDDIIDFTYIKYGQLFTSDSEKLLLESDFANQLEVYIAQYEKLLSDSIVFKNDFNHNSADGVLKTLTKEGFFKAEHKVALAANSELMGEDDFKSIINTEKKRILNNDELSTAFKKIDDKFSGKVGTKDLRELIYKHKEIIPELINIPSLKQKIWISYLFSDKSTFTEAILNYRSNKKRLEEVVQNAENQLSRWNVVVNQFNQRFSNMPYLLEIKNKSDVILRKDLPSISFVYKDRGEVANVNEKELLLHLSNGEKKALYLLNIIFEIEVRKEETKKTLIVMDDVADSFDYRNKYAIIEYIKEIVDNDLFMPIILTHNFDFYRTVAGRLNIKNNSNFASKSTGEVELIHGQYFENVFDSWRDEVYKNDAVFISSIAFVRNIVEYIKGKDNDVYSNLTSLLHYKKNSVGECMATDSIKNKHIIEWYFKEWAREKERFEQNLEQSVISLLFNVAEVIMGISDEVVDIENKIVLSVAIRQKSERYMVNRINNDSEVLKIRKDQTRKLRDLIDFMESDTNDTYIKQIIEKVLIITSENIHINSFMYEPIVDMSLGELKSLYSDVKEYLK